MSEVFIGRQPILDHKMEVFAYELRFHEGFNPNDNTLQTSEALLNKIENEIGFKSIVGEYKALLTLPKALIEPGLLPQMDSPQQLLVQIPATASKDVMLLKNLKELRSQGTQFVLEHFHLGDASAEKLSRICQFVKVNPNLFSEVQLQEFLAPLQDKPIKLIAEHVETEERFLYLKKMGFDYFQGYFFNNPMIINGHKLSGNKLTLLQLLTKVNDPNTDFDELSEIVSQDVALSHKLLVAINNPAAMVPVRVERIADAVRYMGLKRLKFWVNMLMLASMEDVPEELITSSLMRAKFCEMIAEAGGYSTEKDSFFLVGLFSNLGAFFRLPIEDVVAGMPLAEDLKTALIEQKGIKGEALQLLETIQKAESMLDKLSFDGLGLTELGQRYLAASAWAQQAIAQ